MDLVTSVMSFALVAGLVTITPGLDTALVLRTAARDGRRAGFAAALGINTGVLIWAMASAVGVSALLTASEAAYTTVRIVGAAYMVWLGSGMLRAALTRVSRTSHGGPSAEPETAAPGAWRAYRSGCLANLMNPKIGAFYVALLPQFIPRGSNAGWVGALLAMVHNVEGLLWFTALILLVDRARDVLKRPAVQRWIDGVAGSVVIGCGVVLGIESR